MRDGEAEAHASAEGGGRNLPWTGSGAESRTATVGLPKPEALRLMEAVVERNNLFRTYDRVVQNSTAAVNHRVRGKNDGPLLLR